MKFNLFKDLLLITIQCRKEEECLIKESLVILNKSFIVKYKSVSYDESLLEPIISGEIRPNTKKEWVINICIILLCCFVCKLIQQGIVLLK